MIRIGILISAIGLVCLIAFHLFGSSVEPDGFLQEPFGLLPIGYFLIFAGLFVTAFGCVRLFVARRRIQKRDPAA